MNVRNLYKEATVFANSTKYSIQEVESLIKKYGNECVEITGTIKSKFDSQFQTLFQNIDLIEFGILKVKAHSNGISFGVEVITHRNNELIDINIHLPYLSKLKSKRELVEFIEEANQPLCLNFRDKEQIEYTFDKLVDNTFDDKFMDSSWTLKHSSFSFTVGGSTKNTFESKNFETFRPTSYRIKPSDSFGKLIGLREYKKLTIELLANYFSKEYFSLYFNTVNLKCIKQISKMELESVELSLKIDLSKSRDYLSAEDIKYLMLENKSSIEVEYNKMEVEDIASFNAYKYKNENDDYETRLYVDKLANEEWSNQLIERIGADFEYSHNE